VLEFDQRPHRRLAVPARTTNTAIAESRVNNRTSDQVGDARLHRH
jgi:hypothetical protein